MTGQAHEARVSYIPRKMKEEMQALHATDGERWNAATLAQRFGARQENVAGLLKLGRLREKSGKGLSAEEHEKVAKAREEAERAWAGVADGGGKYGRGLKAASRMRKGVLAGLEEEGKEGGEAAGKEETGEEKVEVEVVRKKSATAVWVEELCERAELDVHRKTSFAFIEVGKEGGKEVERAVWIREGPTGS